MIGLENLANTVGFLALALHRGPANVLARYIAGKASAQAFSTRHHARRISNSCGESIT